MQIVIASKNMHKIRELRSLLKTIKNLDVLSLLDFPEYQPTEEIGSSFEEIACKKALHAAQALQKWSIADDSGLVIPCLGGSPGIYSARYAGEGSSDKEKRVKLLKELSFIQEPQERNAYFECCIAISSPEKIQKQVTGLCEGSIALEEKGSKGFGYDSLFIKHEYSKTFAELDEDIKNRISHRRKAFEKIAPFLESIRPVA